jgi:hypothetical protein
MTNVTTIALIGASAMVAGCSCAPGVPVTGRDDKDLTFTGTQAETAAASALAGEHPIIVVTYNDDTREINPATQQPYVQYPSSNRIVYPGASLLGWSYSGDGGKTWTYGGKVRPGLGVAALWGDPAIVTSKYSPNLVYISALAADSAIVPASGHSGGMATSGACIARSTNGGINFSLFQCFGSNRDFYDGATLAAAGSGGDHRIFAAYWDIPNARMDVWQSVDGLLAFTKLGDPFPGLRMTLHPRLAYDDKTGALLIAGMAFNPVGNDIRIYLNRLVGNQWGVPKLASQAITGVEIPVGTHRIRTASGFSFDVGTPSVRRLDPRQFTTFYQDAIRLAYTTRDAVTQRIYVRGTGCSRDLSVCNDEPNWGTTPGNFNTTGHSWSPTVRASPSVPGSPAVWKLTYQTTDDRPDRVSIKQGNLSRNAQGVAVFQPQPLMDPRIVCPDLRYGSAGYWGDYDESAYVGFGQGGAHEFLLAFSDSSKGCISQSNFNSTHVHVRAVRFK